MSHKEGPAKGIDARVGKIQSILRTAGSRKTPTVLLAAWFFGSLMILAGRVFGPQQWIWDLDWRTILLNSAWALPLAAAIAVLTIPAASSINQWAAGHLLRSIIVMVAIVGSTGLLVALILGWVLADTWFWQIDTPDLTAIDLIRLAGAFAAGLGGIVALVVAYQRQQVTQHDDRRAEQAHFTDRFMKAAEMLGSESPGVRLASIATLTRIADENPGAGRQQCIDLLTNYLRLPPGNLEPTALRQIQRAIFSAIGDRLSHGPRECAELRCWHGHTFDLQEVPLELNSMAGWAILPKTVVDMRGSRFSTETYKTGQLLLLGGVLDMSELVGPDDCDNPSLGFSCSTFRSGRLLVSIQHANARLSLGSSSFCGANVSIFTLGDTQIVDLTAAEVSAGTVRVHLENPLDTVFLNWLRQRGGLVSVSFADTFRGRVSLNSALLWGGSLQVGQFPSLSTPTMPPDHLSVSEARISQEYELHLGPFSRDFERTQAPDPCTMPGMGWYGVNPDDGNITLDHADLPTLQEMLVPRPLTNRDDPAR